jgi:hypothetical protein
MVYISLECLVSSCHHAYDYREHFFQLLLLPLEHTANVKCSVSLQSLDLFRQSVGLLGWVISPSQGLYLHIGQQRKTHTHTHTKHPCTKWDSNTGSQRPSERRQFMPQTTRLLWPAQGPLILYNCRFDILFQKFDIIYMENIVSKYSPGI